MFHAFKKKSSEMAYQNSNFCKVVFSGFFMCSGAILYAGSAHAVPELFPHQAKYEMRLLSAEQDTQVVAVTGKVQFEIENDCKGWVSSEDYLIEFSYNSGDSSVMFSHFESWEDFDGKLYSFEVQESSSFEGEKEFMGFASRQGGASESFEAFNSLTPDTPMMLPEDVYFPVHHTQKIIEHAQDGKKLFYADIFYGAEPERSLKRTSTVIGSMQEISEPMLQEMLVQKTYYPVQIAYFDPSSSEATPDYEITFHVQENGVVAYYEVDYGDFALKADLVEITELPEPTCN